MQNQGLAVKHIHVLHVQEPW